VWITRKKLSVGSVRVRKFCATTQFGASGVHSCGLKAPYTLSQGLDKTFQFEFVDRNEPVLKKILIFTENFIERTWQDTYILTGQ
jgi:hypothetical protein